MVMFIARTTTKKPATKAVNLPLERETWKKLMPIFIGISFFLICVFLAQMHQPKSLTVEQPRSSSALNCQAVFCIDEALFFSIVCVAANGRNKHLV